MNTSTNFHQSRGWFLAIGFIITLLAAAASISASAEKNKSHPAKDEKCPVCGMFVSKFPDWTASVRLKSGAFLYFDGAKDLFVFLSDPAKYRPGISASDILDIIVTDYYSLTPINGRTAWYVAGSDVYGPMGKELIPFARETDAREFRKDHGGFALLPFTGITQDILKALK